MNAALLIIDMQNGYFAEEQDRKALPKLVAHINELSLAFSTASLPVVHIRTEHSADGSTWTRPMKEQGKGFCIEGSYEATEVEGLQVVASQHSVRKTRDNAFLYTNLADLLGELGPETLVFAGVSTHECVAATAMEAADRDYLTVLATDCVHSPEPKYRGCITDLLADSYGTEHLSNAQLLKRLTA